MSEYTNEYIESCNIYLDKTGTPTYFFTERRLFTVPADN